MPLKRANKVEPTTVAVAQDLDDGSTGPSPEEVRKDMADSTKNRTSEKRRKLEDTYTAEVEEMNERIDNEVAKDERELAALRIAQLERLSALIQRKAKIETEIVVHTRNLKKTYTNAAEELKMMVGGREGDLKEVLGQDEGNEENADDVDKELIEEYRAGCLDLLNKRARGESCLRQAQAHTKDASKDNMRQVSISEPQTQPQLQAQSINNYAKKKENKDKETRRFQVQQMEKVAKVQKTAPGEKEAEHALERVKRGERAAR